MRRALPAVLLVLVATLLVPGSAQAAETDTARGRSGYYLALGDSLAAGFQPGRGDDLDGGYVGVVHDVMSYVWRRTELVNLACSGETIVTMVEGGRCDYDDATAAVDGSQLAAAEEFLAEHGRATRLITLDIGGNDVQRCVDKTTGTIDQVCIAGGIRAVGARLPTVLAALRAAAPQARIVVLNYYNPFLAAYLRGEAGQALATQSMALQAALNDVIAAAAGATGVRLADVATAFRSTVTTPRTVPGYGTIPTNVAVICSWTWMCTKTDIHANSVGYTVMAATVLARAAWPALRDAPQPAAAVAAAS